MRRVHQLGWAVAAGLAGFMAAGGFQGGTQKVGVVDIGEIFASSNMTKGKQDELRAMGNARIEMLQFVRSYRPFTQEQAQRYRALSVKPNATAAEKAELEKIKADVMASHKSLQALQTKQKPTPDDVSKLNELSQRASVMQTTERRWAQEFDQEMQEQQDQLKQQVLDRIQESVKEVGRKQGYTLIFVRDVAPYAANDVTAEALKAANAKK